MGVSAEIQFRADELARQRAVDGDTPCMGCDGFGLLAFRVNGAKVGYIPCGRCKGSGSEPAEDPISYTCETCGAAGVKLWRDYQTFVDNSDLLCAVCAGQREGDDVLEIDADGYRPGAYGRTDQIGSMVPAVITIEGDTFWGYTSVPPDRVSWWRALPSIPSDSPGP